MAIVTLTAIHLKPGAKWEDAQKHLKKGCDLARKHGAENVTVMVGMASGPATGTVSIVSTSADWTSYGKTQDAMMADPEMQATMADPNSPVAKWDTYVSQTIPDM
jgi:sugar phosphate isomerase/epimerase